MIENTRPYQPSNGTEGDIFMGKFCSNCSKHPISRDAKNQCMILLKSFAYSISDKDYPKQWVQDNNGARCTSFISRDERNKARRSQLKNSTEPDLFD